ncbi:MAG: aromatic acid exporter family protein [Ruminococcus sp.]|nr:aromatic acid exporter family protein [Ruminococcus sp.]
MQKFHIGQRIVKTSIAVFLCMVVDTALSLNPFYSVITAVLCMQKDMETSKTFSLNRIIGTLGGGFLGLITILIRDYCNIPEHSVIIDYIFYSIAIIPLILWTVKQQHKGASFISTVVYFAIVLVHSGQENPLVYVLQRVVETIVGILLSLAVNDCPLFEKLRSFKNKHTDKDSISM